MIIIGIDYLIIILNNQSQVLWEYQNIKTLNFKITKYKKVCLINEFRVLRVSENESYLCKSEIK